MAPIQPTRPPCPGFAPLEQVFSTLPINEESTSSDTASRPVLNFNGSETVELFNSYTALAPTEPTYSDDISSEQLFSTLSTQEQLMQCDSAPGSPTNSNPNSRQNSSEQLFSTLSIKEELMQCDTAPSSPMNSNTSVSQISSFLVEEIQYSLLQILPEVSVTRLNSITGPVSISPENGEDAITRSDILATNEVPSVSETENLRELVNELHNSLVANNESSLSLEELDLCLKVINSFLYHETKFASKSELVKSFIESIKESAKQVLASSSDPQNHSLPEMTNPPLRSRPIEMSNRPVSLIDDLTTFQNKHSGKEIECVASCSYDPITAKERLPEFQYSCSKSPSSKNLSDPRIKTTGTSEIWSQTLSNANHNNTKEILENSNVSYSPLYSNSKSSSTNPKEHVLGNNFASDSPHYSGAKSPSYPSDPRLSTKNRSIYSKSCSNTNTIKQREISENNFESYPHQMQIYSVEPPLKKLRRDQNREGCFNNVHHHGTEKFITKPPEYSPPFEQSESPNIDTLFHQNFSPTQLPFNNMTISSGRSPVSHKTNSHKESSMSFVNLIPHSLIQDIGVNFIQSYYLRLIITEWREEWFSEYEVKSLNKKSSSLPPILNKSNTLSKVQHTYQSEKEHYNTYLKLLLVEYWHKLFISWKNLRQSNKEYFGKIRECESKREYIKYVVEYFIPATEKDNMPNKSSILQLKFKKIDNTFFSALGYVSDVNNRKFDALYDINNEAFKVLNVSRENILKYKIVIYTVYKCNEVDTKQLLAHKNLGNILNIFQQNDALINLNKSPLCGVIFDPVTSPRKLDVSIPDSNGSVSIPLTKMCKQISTAESLLVCVNSSLSFANKVSVIYFLTKEVLNSKPGSKVIICSKSEDTLLEISNDHQKHCVAFIDKKVAPKLQKFSVQKLVERKLHGNPHLTQGDAQSEVLGECTVILTLFPGRYQHDILRAQNAACCILVDAHEFTEPESLIPLSYGITKFVMFGKKDELCNVSQITANYGYNRSLFNRITT